MCGFGNNKETLVMPQEIAAQRAVDSGAARTAAQRRTMDKVSIATPTILTSSRGVLQPAPTERKTLLGA